MGSNITYFRVATPIGDVWVHPLRDGQILVHSRPSTSLGYCHEGGGSIVLPVTVNRVPSLIRGWMDRGESGTYMPVHDWWITRQDGKDKIYDPANNARLAKAKPVVIKAVQEFMSSDAAGPLLAAMNRAELRDAASAADQLRREVVELEIQLAEKRKALAASEKRMAVARGDVAECGCDLLAYPAGHQCKHTRPGA